MERTAFFDQLVWLKKIETSIFASIANNFNVSVILRNAYCCFEVDSAILFFEEKNNHDPAQSSFEVIYVTANNNTNLSAPALVFLIDGCHYLVIHTEMTRLNMPKVTHGCSLPEPPYAAIEWTGGLILRFWLSLSDLARPEAVRQLSEAVKFINDNLTAEVMTLPTLQQQQQQHSSLCQQRAQTQPCNGIEPPCTTMASTNHHVQEVDREEATGPSSSWAASEGVVVAERKRRDAVEAEAEDGHKRLRMVGEFGDSHPSEEAATSVGESVPFVAPDSVIPAVDTVAGHDAVSRLVEALTAAVSSATTSAKAATAAAEAARDAAAAVGSALLEVKAALQACDSALARALRTER